MTTSLKLLMQDFQHLWTRREWTVQNVRYNQIVTNLKIKAGRVPRLTSMVAGVIAALIRFVAVYFRSKFPEGRCNVHVHGVVSGCTVYGLNFIEHVHAVVPVQIDDLLVTHGHNIGAATVVNELKRVPHEAEREVLSSMLGRYGQSSDLKAGLNTVFARRVNGSGKDLFAEVFRQPEGL